MHGPLREAAIGVSKCQPRGGAGKLLPPVTVWLPQDLSSLVKGGHRDTIHGRKGSGGGHQAWGWVLALGHPLPYGTHPGKRSFLWGLWGWLVLLVVAYLILW